MNDLNGVSNYDVLQEVHEARVEQAASLARLESALRDGFDSVAGELRALRGTFEQGFLKTINILCYCLVAIIMWVTAVKTLPMILGASGDG
jgi:hypothetical protein